ncbi:endogenous retrovirus group K member 10 Gag polyprotein-like [Macrotis lagotis]|uniref:endogenous retrovirus group K member 10 Gag polyprotein-like n=1 Tax=Macrotis lagotis TaxID=92651 RepID=UPI003D6886FF
MGTKLSTEQVFIQDLKSNLRERGVKVKKKDLVKFFLFVDEVCPWFLVNGPYIHPGKWQKVGRDLNRKLQTEGPDAVPPTAFSYWGLIRDIVESASGDLVKHQLLSVAESCLRPLSRAVSLKSLEGKENIPAPTDDNLICPVFPKHTPLSKAKAQSEGGDALSQEEEADLEVEAARYNNLDWPPLLAPPSYLTAPAFLPPEQETDSFIEAKRQLTTQVKNLREVLELQTQYAQLSGEIAALQKTLQKSLQITAPIYDRQRKNVRNKTKIKTRQNMQFTFPIFAPSTGGQGGAPDSSQAEGGDEIEVELSGDEEGSGREEEEEVTQTGRAERKGGKAEQRGENYRNTDFKTIKDLHSAVKNYGPNAPFTLSALDSISQGGYLLPSEWLRVVQAVLTRGQFLTWKADFLDRCQTLATDKGEFANETKQRSLPLGLLAQTANAATAAWRALPASGSPLAPLNKIIQGNQEDFSEYVSRLLETTERTLGQEAANDQLVRRLAYENANSACRSILRGHWREKTLDEMIKLCQYVDPISSKMSQAVHLAIGAAFQNLAQARTCFRCGQEGHFARQCPNTESSSRESGHRSILPLTPCPRCKRGRHWASTCRSATDINGKSLIPVPGNSRRGQPRTPLNNSQQATGNSLPKNSYAEQPQGAQGWTCVPPPPQL